MKIINIDKQIFIINGSGGVGKDSFVSLVREEMLRRTNSLNPVVNYSSVDKIKSIAKAIGWEGQKSEKDRKFLSDLKILTSEYNDMPFNSMRACVEYFKTNYSLFLFLHIREPEEIERAVREFGAKTILVTRKSVSKITSNMADKNVLNYKYDYLIKNDGDLENLKEMAVSFIDDVIANQKQNLFIDYDGTIVNTIKAIVSMYDEDFKYYSNYKKVNWEEIETWNFSELAAATPEYINTYFNQQRFFDRVEFMPDAENILRKLSKKYNIIIVSHGFPPNLKAKEIWVKEHMSYAKFIGVNMKKYNDKSNVDMKNGVFIDDRQDNLETSNAKIKICFGKLYFWNSKITPDIFNCFTWKEVEELLLHD